MVVVGDQMALERYVKISSTSIHSQLAYGEVSLQTYASYFAAIHSRRGQESHGGRKMGIGSGVC